MSLFKEVKLRWKSPTPYFWKKVRAKGAYLGSLGTVVATVQAKFPALKIPDLIFTISGHLAVVGFVMVILANLTKDDNTAIDEEKAKELGRDTVG